MTFITVFVVLVFSYGCSGCGEGCASCAGISQKCLACKNGYWFHANNCEHCPDNCEQCLNDTHCSKCKTGFYGTTCLLKCSLCMDGLCDIEDGRCTNGCIDGYFEDSIHPITKCRKCLDSCKLCQSYGICSKCDTGFYIHSYKTNNITGNTVAVCLSCLPDCEECNFTANNCTVCKPGTYGPFCQYNCSDAHCNRCDKADDVEICTECATGNILDGTTCVPVITCSQNCVYGCEENQLCLGGCNDGWSGQTCTMPCTSQCKKCQQDNDKICTECKGDSFTSSCNASCNVHCSKSTFGVTCSLRDGLCANGCVDGYWGNTCNKSCYEGCNSPRCHQTDGHCASCHRNYYGYACKHTCSEHCFDDGSIHQICRTPNGKCELGCISGYSGDRCEYSSSSIITSTSGTEQSSCNSQLHQQDCSETKFYILGFVSGVGLSLMAAAGFGLFCFLRRRQKLTSEPTVTLETKEEKAYENTTMGMRAMSSTETDYERLQGDRLDDQQQYTGCGYGCTICNGISQLCQACSHGYWMYNNMCQPCQDKCEQCVDRISYSKCRTGFYGTSCTQNCTLCKDGMCGINEGQCISGCIDGYYEDTANTVKRCRKCSDNCSLCESQIICLECDNCFFKLTYESSPGFHVDVCYSCLPVCEDCTTSYNCTVCKSGTHGPLCQYNCSDSHCNRCNKANDVEKCTECATEHLLDGSSCVPEITCSQNCANGCDENKLCVSDCKDEWSGQTCTQKCVSQCQKCQQNNNKVCMKCMVDFFSSSCNTPCNEHCSEGSPAETCSLHDGFCVNGCTDGYWGGTCNRTCYVGCNSAQCNQTNSFCATWLRSFYGGACQHTCSEHCFGDGSIHQICRTFDGKCAIGCISGYSGERCEYPTNSTITFPPTSGNTGTEECKCNSQLHQQDCSEAKFYVLGIVTGVGLSLIVAAGFGLFCFLKRRQKLTSETTRTLETKEEKAYENTTMGMRAMSSTETDYERLQGDKRDDQQQYTELGRPEQS